MTKTINDTEYIDLLTVAQMEIIIKSLLFNFPGEFNGEAVMECMNDVNKTIIVSNSFNSILDDMDVKDEKKSKTTNKSKKK